MEEEATEKKEDIIFLPEMASPPRAWKDEPSNVTHHWTSGKPPLIFPEPCQRYPDIENVTLLNDLANKIIRGNKNITIEEEQARANFSEQFEEILLKMAYERITLGKVSNIPSPPNSTPFMPQVKLGNKFETGQAKQFRA